MKKLYACAALIVVVVLAMSLAGCPKNVDTPAFDADTGMPAPPVDLDGETSPNEPTEAADEVTTDDEATTDDDATADEATADDATADEATADDATADEATADDATDDEGTEE